MGQLDWGDLYESHQDEIRQLEQGRSSIPDHVKTARSECAQLFLNDVLLPKLAEKQQIGKEMLIHLLTEFKDRCYQLHPNDLGEGFSLMQEVDRQLFLRDIEETAEPSENAELLSRVTDFIYAALADYPDDLYPI